MKKNFLLLLSSVTLLVCWAWGLFGVGADADQGNVFRIMFVHVPVAWCAFVWVITGGVFGFLGLLRKNKRTDFDRSSHAAMELGTLFAALALVTGMIWGRPTWGVWWDWDPRLTTTLVLFLVCCGYHILRTFTPEISQQRTVSALVAVISCVNIPVVYYSVNVWRSIHQPQTFTRSGSLASSDITKTLWLNVFAMIIFSVILYKTRRRGIVAIEILEAARQQA